VAGEVRVRGDLVVVSCGGEELLLVVGTDR